LFENIILKKHGEKTKPFRFRNKYYLYFIGFRLIHHAEKRGIHMELVVANCSKSYSVLVVC